MIVTFLTAIGSIGGFITLYYGAKYLINAIKSIYAGREARSRNHYYKFTEVSCRWLCQERKYQGFWTCELVSRVEGHNGIRVGMGPKSIGNFTITKGILRKIEAPENTEWIDYMYDITPSLHKRDKKVIHYEYEAEAHTGMTFPKYWMFVSESRCDKLLLRVVFDEIPHNDIKFRIENQIGRIIFEERLGVDFVSKECKKEVCNPRPGFIYKIDWNNTA